MAKEAQRLGPGMRALGMGFSLAITIVGSGMMGYFIGKEFSEFKSILGLIFGLFFGLVGGLYQAYKLFA